MGLVIFTPFVGALAWLWPLALIGVGAWLVLRRPDMQAMAADLTRGVAPAKPVVAPPVAPPVASSAVAAQPAAGQPVAAPAPEPVEPALMR
jgi:hypothetical protein